MGLSESQMPPVTVNQVTVVQGKTPVNLSIRIQKTAALAIAIGEQTITGVCVGMLASDQIFVDSSFVWPSGYGFCGLVPGNGQGTMKIHQPGILLGQSIDLTIPLIALR